MFNFVSTYFYHIIKKIIKFNGWTCGVHIAMVGTAFDKFGQSEKTSMR